MAKREKPVTFGVFNSTAGKFDVKFTGPMGEGKVSIRGIAANDDFDLLRQIIAVRKDSGNVKLDRTLTYMDEWHTGCTIRHRQWSYGNVKHVLAGQPDPAPEPIPTYASRTLSPHDAKMEGFATFNGGPHLCVEVPNGNFTISVRTLEGKKITFAFCPYKEGGPAQCVDVLHHTSGVVIENGDTDCPAQEVIAFTVGRDLFRSKLSEKPGEGCSTLAVLLKSKGDE